MHTQQDIGTLAERIVAVNIRLDGTITPVLRERNPEGRMIDVGAPALQRAEVSGDCDFVVRVPNGDYGVVAVGPKRWGGEYAAAIIPVGSDATATLGSAPESTEVRFHYEAGRLSWKHDAASGEAVVNETYPELDVVLRLAPGNHGEIAFASPLFTTADGESASVLRVA